MTDQKLIRHLNRLLGEDREPLRQTLLEVKNDLTKWENVAKDIKKKTKLAMHYGLGLFEETVDNLADPKFDLLWTGDCSYWYSMILNQGIKRG